MHKRGHSSETALVRVKNDIMISINQATHQRVGITKSANK